MADETSPYAEAIAHYDEWDRLTMKMAADFATDAIKNCFMVNAGAMVAIPAAIALFGIDTRASFIPMLWITGCFVVGLLAAWFASMFAFVAMSSFSDHHSQMRAAEEWDENAHGMTKNPPPVLDQEKYVGFRARSKASEATADKLFSRYRYFRRFGIAACLASLLAFMGGAGYGANVLMNAPKKWDATTSSPAPKPQP